MIRGHGTAIVAVRNEDESQPTTEMADLADAAGYEVAVTHAAVAPCDSTYGIPPGLVDTIADAVAAHDATAVVVDDELTPTQAFELRDRLPTATEVVDRTRLILATFRNRAGTKRARLETDLARLKYELPRLRAAIRHDQATEITAHDEGGKQIEDRKRRIDEIQRKLDDLEDPTASRQQTRREAGFDLVALAGYTNAGKTTLLRQLADDLAVDETGHDDVTAGPAVRDRLFETLETTTRRATIAGRPTLVTDTVGFVRDLPHELVASFEATLASAFGADLVLLVIDANDTVEQVGAKLAICRETLADVDTLPVLNKVDAVDEEHLQTVRDVVDGDPVEVSAATAEGLDRLKKRVATALPTASETLSLPNCGAAMAFVSWAHEELAVETVDYGERIDLRVRGRPSTIAEARRRAEAVASDGEAGGENARVEQK